MTYKENGEDCTLASYVERFIKERQFLKGVTPATIEWYRHSFKAFAPVLSVPYQSSTALKAAVIERIGQLQTAGRGNKAVSINTYLRCLKTFLRWAHEEGIVKELVKLSWLKEEQKILSTFSPEQVGRIIHWKPVGSVQARLHVLSLTALDTGMRIEELLGLTREQVDFDNLSFRVHGKGNKHRLVPMSIELRKVLYRHTAKHNHRFIFARQDGCKLAQRNLLRQFKVMCGKLGIAGVRCSFHTLRHSFAVNYLRAGGNLYYLQRILGHSSITTTENYLRSLGIDDLKAVHNGLSSLSR